MTGYTYWAHFKNYEQAAACKADLPDYVVQIEGPTDCRTDWLLRAGHGVPRVFPDGWKSDVESIVAWHGGEYDGGEMTSMRADSGQIDEPDPGPVGTSTGMPANDDYLKSIKAILGDLYTDRVCLNANNKERRR